MDRFYNTNFLYILATLNGLSRVYVLELEELVPGDSNLDETVRLALVELVDEEKWSEML